jgi:hypothetical protein
VTTLLFVNRGPRADRHPWFEWKVRLFLAGAAIALVGIATGRDWIVAVATFVLFAAFVLRFFPRGRGPWDGEPGHPSGPENATPDE